MTGEHLARLLIAAVLVIPAYALMQVLLHVLVYR